MYLGKKLKMQKTGPLLSVANSLRPYPLVFFFTEYINSRRLESSFFRTVIKHNYMCVTCNLRLHFCRFSICDPRLDLNVTAIVYPTISHSVSCPHQRSLIHCNYKAITFIYATILQDIPLIIQFIYHIKPLAIMSMSKGPTFVVIYWRWNCLMHVIKQFTGVEHTE